MANIIFPAAHAEPRPYIEMITREGRMYKNENPVAVVVILGRHANAMAIPEGAYLTIQRYLERAVYGGYVGVVIADGMPTTTNLVDTNFFIENARNTIYLENIVASRVGSLMEKIRDTNIRAQSPEVDLLAAIREAQNILQSPSIAHIGDRHIVIISTGISTTGDLNFLNLDFNETLPRVDSIVDTYLSMGLLPSLSGIDVTFIGFDDGMAVAAYPQQSTTVHRRFISDLWYSLIWASGACSVIFENSAGWNTPNIWSDDNLDIEFPFVSVVPLFENRPVFAHQNPTVEHGISNVSLGFASNTAAFLNEYAAMQIIAPFGNVLEEFFQVFPSERIWIVGTTAMTIPNSNDDDHIDLSFSRAERVKEALIASGYNIPVDNLLTIGLGTQFPWRVDEFADGLFNSVAAQTNRAVWLLSEHADSEMFNALKKADNNDELFPTASLRFRMLLDEPPPSENHTYVVNIRFANAVFTGWVIRYTDIPDGTGTMWFDNGDVYTGEWVNGEITGFGTMQYSNEDIYVGFWLDGQRHGQGVYTWSDGRTYEGEYRYSQRYGLGVFTGWIDMDNGWSGTFKGQSINNSFEGYGVFLFDNGDEFSGEFRNSRRWTGTHFFNDGRTALIVDGRAISN